VLVEIHCDEEVAFTADLLIEELVPGGVEDGEGVAERRLNIDCCTGTPFSTAYEVCEVINGGRATSERVPNTSPPLVSAISEASVEPIWSGLDEDMLEEAPGFVGPMLLGSRRGEPL